MRRSSSDEPAGAVPTSNAPPSPPDSYSTTTVEPRASSRVERYLRSLGGSSSSSAGSSSSQPQKKWVPEQGHWETDYGQVWIPNVVYVRHERYWVNHGGTKVGPFDSKAAAWAWCDNDVDNGGIGGSVIDDSYTTSEDQGTTSSRRPAGTGSSTWPGTGSSRSLRAVSHCRCDSHRMNDG